MIFKIDVELNGYIELEAESEEEAKEHAEDGFSLDQFQCVDTEIGEIEELKQSVAKA